MKKMINNNDITLETALILIKEMAEENETLSQENKALTQENKALNQKVEDLTSQLDWLKRQIFGQKSERFVPKPDMQQDDLFGFSEDDIEDADKGESLIPAHTRTSRKKKSSKLSFGDSVLVVEEIVDIDDKFKVCPITGEPLEIIGYDTKEQLLVMPGKFMKLIIKRPKYALKTDGNVKILQAKAKPELIRGSKFHVSFLAHLCVQKFVFHMPLNRIIEELRNKDITVSSQALSNLVINIGEKITPLFELMKQELFKQKYIFTDDTGSKMLERGSPKAKSTFVWTYTGGELGKPQYMIYLHTLGRGQDIPAKHLANFKGTITADAFGGYEKLDSDPESGIEWSACWDHARRNFEPYATSSKICRFMLDAICELSINERECWLTDSKGRLDIRKEVQTPIVEAMFEELEVIKKSENHTPNSKITKAINYMLKRKEVFCRFLTNPMLRIENNTAERTARKIVMGRNAWMFFGSESGAEAGCKIMSLMQTCRNLDIKPEEYLLDIFNELATMEEFTEKNLRPLLPDVWQKKQSKIKK